MPQNFQVLRCFSCLVFQVHPTKKANKFECKLCSEKQSIKRHYGFGTGKECRIHVQKLNSVNGALNETCTQDEEDCDELESSNKNIDVDEVAAERESKWLQYVDENEFNNLPHDTMFLDDTEVVLDIPKKQSIYNRNNKLNRNKNTFKAHDYSEDISKQYGKRKLYQEESIEINSTTNISECNVKIEPLLSQKTSNDGPKVIAKRFVPPVVNKSSKWAQFADASEDIENGDISNDLNEEFNEPQEQDQLNLVGASEGKSKDLNNSYRFNEEKHVDKKLRNEKLSAYEHLSLQTLNKHRMPMKFVQPVISKQSKWAEYHNDNIKQNIRHRNESASHCQSNRSSSKPQKLFSLCDDSDLDTVLDI